MKTRRSKDDWLDHGLAVLAQSGISAIKAEPLAKSLNVSRGSFYWHFRDIEDFHIALLRRWREVRTDGIIAEVEQANPSGERLKHWMRKAMCGNNALERAVRSWATENQRAAATVASVDKIRLKYLAAVLSSEGLSSQQINARAAFLYWGYVGRIMIGHGASKLRPLQLDGIAESLLPRTGAFQDTGP
ncbi:TetR/AcrR family transcriptional regulator [Denitrobaculum tricleocarpae]|uniref:TetR/AcrR family transcriptional regulator n=1 Tax=Denitrobaculum tricleocarpae TaxID=2591009 RepID=A0A545TKY5_9PROT|nr:TetR/AcrR family transcriptional regulator [Denitrobaculum tricleocarpae]TQV77885.1 TetR/AcrR family transcriptional regulator [Denitrobaculum tricleocarpae]